MSPQRLGIALAFSIAAYAAPAAADTTLDYEFFKAKVEPIFLKKRDDHVRCYVCHTENNAAFKLEKLPEGATFWTEEQSRRQFEAISQLVVPGNPAQSRLLLQPLALEAGGNPYHSGGRQFPNKNDPYWKTMEQWVMGQKISAK